MTIQEWRRMYHAIKRQERLDAGMCTRCGKNAPPEGRRICTDCLLKIKGLYAAKYGAAQTALRATEEYRRKISAYNRGRYERLVSEGICYICGRRPAAEGQRSCRECRRKISEQRRERKEQGICLNCGKKHADGRVYCFSCRVKMSKTGAVKDGE